MCWLASSGRRSFLVLAIGAVAIVLLLLGEKWLPGRPVALCVVALAIVCATLFGLPAQGVPITGEIPSGLPNLAMPELRIRDVEGIFPLAAGCLLLAYVEGVSAGRTFAAKHGYTLDMRQEFLGIGAANLVTALGHGYPVAGGLSQSAVNDKAGARRRSPWSSPRRACTLSALSDRTFGKSAEGGFVGSSADCNPRLVRFSRACAYVAREPDRLLCCDDRACSRCCCSAFCNGILLAALACIALLLMRVRARMWRSSAASPVLKAIPTWSVIPDNEPLPNAIVVRPEASLIYVNAGAVLEAIQNRLRSRGCLRNPYFGLRPFRISVHRPCGLANAA